MPVVFYPPNMPLHEQFVFHRRHLENYWATPIPFIPLVIAATLLFIGSIWGLDAVHDHTLPNSINPQVAQIFCWLLPPLIMMGVMLIIPHLSSPIWPYQLALVHDPENHELRWNLAVVATAHLYCGNVAQTEWLSQLVGLTTDDRARAFSYIKGVRSRLQQIHVLAWHDIVLCFASALTVFLVRYLCFPNNQYSQIEALLEAIILLLVVTLLMFYLLLQRWQHIRRLIELEEVFDELLPAKHPGASDQAEDEVERWYREQNTDWAPTPAKSSTMEYPPAPWE